MKLRKGDHVVGMSRPAGRNEKNPGLLEVYTVNGGDPEAAKKRPHFESLTALFPDQRLTLEDPNDPANRIYKIRKVDVAGLADDAVAGGLDQLDAPVEDHPPVELRVQRLQHRPEVRHRLAPIDLLLVQLAHVDIVQVDNLFLVRPAGLFTAGVIGRSQLCL